MYVQVLDENDNNPYFVTLIKNLTAREDAVVGTEIGVIEAMDPDSSDFGKVTYLLDRMSSQVTLLLLAPPLDRSKSPHVFSFQCRESLPLTLKPDPSPWPTLSTGRQRVPILW